MARNDEGEFELILGNKQLLSVFFIVVVLLGVFFSMGYIMGRNSNPVVAEAPKSNEPPLIVDASKPSAAPPPVTTPPPAPKADPKRSEPQVEIRNETARKEEPKKTEPPKEEKKAAPPVEAKKKDPDPLPRKVEEPKETPVRGAAPAAGSTYLQVVAAKKQEAELISELLGRKGYKTFLSPIADKPDMIRVLVGPIQNAQQQAKINDELKGQGFKPFPRKM